MFSWKILFKNHIKVILLRFDFEYYSFFLADNQQAERSFIKISRWDNTPIMTVIDYIRLISQHNPKQIQMENTNIY